ncbi:hypothetical protein ETAA8_12690 [Anatilimnocola aggregata]|uniref:Uncharacterized protein n=1 Tax=Anatilimnocola aggregata TaxID=2528021 RepID=A0A517Y7H2_9BACT|nr:DUF1549 domain-containing protein [Anatilimnocola aggregata]QDU26194.1 hypothetical protein ETAA8_12690 [Anatilimnocola aggregata]
MQRPFSLFAFASIALLQGTLLSSLSPAFAAEGVAIDPAKLPGIVIDDSAAKFAGTWSDSVNTKPFVGEGYSYSAGGAGNLATFSFDVEEAGEYQVLFSYTPGGNRSTTAKVTVRSGDTEKDYVVNQQRVPVGAWSLHWLAEFSFDAGPATIVVSAEDNKKGVVIADAFAIMTAEQWAKLKAEGEKNAPPKLLAAIKPVEPKAAPKPGEPKTAKPAPMKKETPKVTAEKALAFERSKSTKVNGRLKAEQLDTLMEKFVGGIVNAPLTGDEAFLRRLSLDLIGRQPTMAEMHAFLADHSMDKRARVVEKLLASTEFGTNWADYFSDVISYRTPQPELTFLNYRPFKNWLAEEFNKNTGWDEMTYNIITASGTVGENPAATYVGFHQGDKSRLASETTRVFLSTQIQCAECHDHKFIDMPQETFHHVAAFFVRVQTKLPWNDSNQIVVSSKAAGEHKMPVTNKEMQPIAFSHKSDLGQSDILRRTELAKWIVGADNPWFAKAFTNRVWARLMGRGFCEPVDEIGELADSVLPEVHAALAEHFVASEFDIKDVFRTVVNSQAYQRPLRDALPGEDKPFAVVPAGRLRGDEVFASLKAGIDLPNITPPPPPVPEGVRFPPPPKSTQDLINDAFGFDPSAEASNVNRTMQQAMFLMNNDQIQKQIDASPGSGTVLAKIVTEEADDAKAIVRLYQSVLARKPTEKEVQIGRTHLAKVGERKTGYEDLLWSMINSAEFLSRR